MQTDDVKIYCESIVISLLLRNTIKNYWNPLETDSLLQFIACHHSAFNLHFPLVMIIAWTSSETNYWGSINSLFHAHQASKQTVLYQSTLATVVIHQREGVLQYRVLHDTAYYGFVQQQTVTYPLNKKSEIKCGIIPRTGRLQHVYADSNK